MTRFKELRRIETALDDRNAAELRWALNYCEQRIPLARLKAQRNYWRKLAEQISAALPADPAARDS